MTTSEFITSAISKFYELFDDRQLRYVYSKEDNTHMFLISEETRNTQLFADYDVNMTNEAWELNIEGLLLFTSSEVMANLYAFKVYPNPKNNDALLDNIDAIFRENPYTQASLLSGLKKELDSKQSFVADGNQPNYAMAA